DGRPDVAFSTDGGPRAFLSTANGPWRAVASPLGTTERAVVLGDCDNDGFRDLFGNGGSNGVVTQLRNARDGGFTDNTAASGLANQNSEGGALLDFDRDGRLDYVQPDGTAGDVRLWRNAGNCSFVDHTVAANLPAGGLGNGEQVLTLDYDADGDVDIFYTVAQQGDGGVGHLYLYRNGGTGTFTEVSATTALAGVRIDYRAGLAAGDWDNDGDFDLFIGRDQGRPRTLLRNDGATFTDVTAASGDLATDTGFEAEGSAFADFDNDGRLDLYVAADNAVDRVYRNVGMGRFVALNQTGHTDSAGGRESTGVAVADFDLDGALDVFVNTSGAGPTHLYVNGHGSDAYLKVKVRGRGAGNSPVDGSGAVVQLFDATGTVLRATREVSGGAVMGQSDALVHFGLAASWGGANGSYVVKVRFNSALYTRPGTVVPATSTLTVGGTQLRNTVEVVEPG
ncbi:MAG: VCBS repeat-containing protein, partial [Myxococcaceae bacterium]|nr:VCBS repeat-containing protein [Myxococcaceae bacterium]